MEKGWKIFSKDFNIFFIVVSIPQNNSPWWEGHDKKAPLQYFRLRAGFDVEKFTSYVLFSLLAKDVLCVDEV